MLILSIILDLTKQKKVFMLKIELLNKIDEAIVAILEGGQNVSIDGLSYSQANLQTLIDYRDKIKMDIANSQGRSRMIKVNLNGFSI